MLDKICRLGSVAVVLLLILGMKPAVAEVTVIDLQRDVDSLLNEVEQIRTVMGIRPPRARDFALVGVVPRQIYFQARTLFNKTNTLAQEVAGVSRQSLAPAPDRDLTLDDSAELLADARAQLAIVREALEIAEAPAPAKPRRRAKAEDVMHDIIEAGYILNQMTTETPDWTQIYDRVYQTITYVGGVLEEDVRYPSLEPFECCKQPEAVYARLVGTMEAARQVATKHGLELVKIVPRVRAEGGASPETVYDLTTTLVSDFGELTLRMDGDDIAGPNYARPARILPSHVYQLVSALEQQVKLLR